MSVNPFVNSQKSLPKSDAQIIRIPFDQEDIGGRKSNLPAKDKNDMTIKHVGSGS